MKNARRQAAVTVLLLSACTLLVSSFAFAAEPLKITVYGASGRIGTRIVQEALNRGHHVTGVARTPADIAIKNANLKVVAGDVTDSDAVARQVRGQDVVVSAIGGGTPATPQDSIEYRATVSLAKALQSLGASGPRLIVVGGASTLDATPGGRSRVQVMADENRLPAGIGNMLMGHQLALDHLRATDGIRWTVETPAGSIKPGERTGKFRLGENTAVTDASGNSAISMEDFAVAMVNEMEKPQYIGRRFTVGY